MIGGRRDFNVEIGERAEHIPPLQLKVARKSDAVLGDQQTLPPLRCGERIDFVLGSNNRVSIGYAIERHTIFQTN